LRRDVLHVKLDRDPDRDAARPAPVKLPRPVEAAKKIGRNMSADEGHPVDQAVLHPAQDGTADREPPAKLGPREYDVE
jgi:hypothetical protein